MDQFVTTYRKDYLWPYVRVMGNKPHPDNMYPPLSTGDHGEMCPCYCMAQMKPTTTQKVFGPNVLKQDVWSRLSPVGPLIDPKMYPARVGRAPEDEIMRYNQPNVFLKKLQDKYPYVYEILRTAPPDDMISRINRDRLRTTYQVDYCNMNEYPNAPYDELLRAAGVQGVAPCPEPVHLPGDPCRPNQRPIAFRPATITKELRIKGNIFGGATRGAEGGIGAGKDFCGSHGLANVTPGITEYKDEISKLGELIIRDKIHHKIRPTLRA